MGKKIVSICRRLIGIFIIKPGPGPGDGKYTEVINMAVKVDKFPECILKGHDWQAVFSQHIDTTTIEIEYECLNCGHLSYDYQESSN